MGRPRKSRSDLPKRVYLNHGAYYFVDANGKWHPLGRSHAKAMQKWAELMDEPTAPIVKLDSLFNRYITDILPGKAPRTQADNLAEFAWLRPFFGEMGVNSVKPTHIATYRDSRKGKVRANREIALLSHVYRMAIEWGIVEKNPCESVRRNKEVPRDRYVPDEELEAFLKLCPTWLKAYLELKNMLALRQQDMLELKWDNFEKAHIHTFIQKVPKNINIAKTEEVVEVISRLDRNGSYLFPLRNGEKMNKNAFSSAWTRVMSRFIKAGGERFTEHDIRGKVHLTEEAAVAHAEALLSFTKVRDA